MNISPPSVGAGQLNRRSRKLRRTAFVAAVLLTLIAMFYAVENRRGRMVWEEYRAELKAKGEELDWATYVPERVPDEQNFIKTPLLEAVGYRGRVATNMWQSLEDARGCLVWEAWVDSRLGRKMDWARCQAALRRRPNLSLPPLPQEPAADLLHALESIEPQLNDLRAASLRPLARFDIDRSAPFEESPDINFVAVRALCQILAYHACAELALDHSDKAFEDVRVIHRLSDGLKGESTLVALMIRVAVQGLALEPFWQGWAEGRWSERELASFEELFGRVDLLPEFPRVLRAERAGLNSLVEKYGIRRNELWRVTMRSDPVAKGWWEQTRRTTQRLPWKLVPRGWVCQNLVSYNQRIQAFLPPSLQATPPTISPAQVDELRERLSREIPKGAYGWLGQMAIPSFAKAVETLARVQTFVNQARIVCALERCRSARGQYPESLAELAPPFLDRLPVDVIDGQPMKYRRTKEGNFLLYSVGWNKRDDGGIPAERGDASANPASMRTDWGWRFPN